MAGYATIYTMAPVFSLVLDRDVSEDLALIYPELYKELTKVNHIYSFSPIGLTSTFSQGRALSFKTFFMWLMISLYQGNTLPLLYLSPMFIPVSRWCHYDHESRALRE